MHSVLFTHVPLPSAGETVLIDAGGMVGPYGADISRTYPVSGEFTPAQRELYEAVLDVQLRLIKVCAAAFISRTW